MIILGKDIQKIRIMDYWSRDLKFIKTTYDISLDSQISLLPLGFSLLSRIYASPGLWNKKARDIRYEHFLETIINHSIANPSFIICGYERTGEGKSHE